MNATTSNSKTKNPQYSYNELICQLQLRNDEAFKYLYNAYSSALLASIRRNVKCKLTAEDILQNVFIKIWLHINTYSCVKGRLFGWMVSIARHEAIDYLRSKYAKDSGLTTFLHESETEALPVQTELIRFDLSRSISCIPGKNRMIVELYNRGFTCKEIGELLSLPLGTVKTKMRTSFKKLRAILT